MRILTLFPARSQRGIVLIVSLIVLAAMSLAAIGIVRSVYTSNRVAGNLAFQQSATHSAQLAIERAVDFITTKSGEGGVGLYNNIAAGPGQYDFAYAASRSRAADPTGSQSWEKYWTEQLVPALLVKTLPEDSAGNKVGIVIQRLCNTSGSREAGAQCAGSPESDTARGNSKSAGSVKLETTSQYYYRITARVEGPRNTRSFVQAVIAK